MGSLPQKASPTAMFLSDTSTHYYDCVSLVKQYDEFSSLNLFSCWSYSRLSNNRVPLDEALRSKPQFPLVASVHSCQWMFSKQALLDQNCVLVNKKG